MTEAVTYPATRDVYREITDHIIAAIEAGTEDFEMPWHREIGTTLPTNAFTGNPYKGVNVIALWASAEVREYRSGLWATYKQWRLLGAQVRRKEKGSAVVFYKETARDVVDEQSGKTETKTVLFARASFVFNAGQVDGWQAPKPVVRSKAEVLEHVEALVRATGADVRHGGDRAYYRVSTDHIQMPERDCFTGTKSISATESYYATLFHELTHWTGHKSRLNRDLGRRFGKGAYAMEELVAELGAAFLCSEHGITNEPRPDHAAYIGNWLEVLRNDKKAIFTAASKASQARDYLGSFERQAQTIIVRHDPETVLSGDMKGSGSDASTMD